MSRKILITGYSGFIGSNLTKKLKDYQINGIGTKKNNSVKNHYYWSSVEECQDIDCIVHLAGIAHDTQNTMVEQEYYNINVGLTQKIFQHFLKSFATKFIFFSSVKAVTDSVEGDQLTEEVLPNPKTPYGKSKFEAEKYILSELEKWKEEEMTNGRDIERKKVYILRPCMIHGPGNKGNLNLLYKLQKKGLPWPLGTFENKQSFCSIDNVLYVVQRLINDNIEEGIYNIADDESLSTNQLIRLMANSLYKKAIIWNISPKTIRLIAKIGDILGLPINSERLKKLTESYIVSNHKLKNALGIVNMPVTAIDGMKLTIESFKKRDE